ncbi:MAG: hypothetical protein J5601_05720 [Elusimicrobiaceae bacterium]|nr:hypothetical protein [Elusimicrobiaceae bacterium]
MKIRAYKIPSWISLVFWVSFGIVAGFLFLQCFPSFFGWLAAVVLGPLASFFASHDTIYGLTRSSLLAIYSALAVGGLDLIFLLIMYVLLNKITPQQHSRREIVMLTLRCGWKLWTLQVFLGIIICLSLFWNDDFSAIWLVPPFMTSSIPNSLYMMVWEISLVLFGLGFAISPSRRQALTNGAALLLNYWWVWLIVIAVGFGLTLLPSVFIDETVPAFVLLLWGMINHVILFVAALIFFFNQPDLFEEDKPAASAAAVEDPLPEIPQI